MPDVVALGQVVTFSKGAGLSKSDISQRGRSACIHYGELFTQYGAVIDTVRSRTNLRMPVMSVEGDVLMPTSDVTPRGLAKAAAIAQSGVGLGGDILIIRPDRRKVDGRYLAYAIRHDANQVLGLVRGSTVYHLYPADMSHFLVQLPAREEQVRIADALQAADDLIAMLERMLARKQAIKQGIMQGLLTGKARLPGFVGQWKTATLREFMPLQRGFDLPSSQVVPGPYPVVYSNGVARHHAKAVVKGPGVVTGRSGTIGKVHFVEQDYWPHNTSLWVTNFDRVDPHFAYYFLAHLGLERFASGSGVPTFNRNDAHSFIVTLPVDRSEQVAIACALKNVDAELAILERRLVKSRLVKTGMMQELLTGRTRLPTAEVAV